jgi:hypothetical protein
MRNHREKLEKTLKLQQVLKLAIKRTDGAILLHVKQFEGVANQPFPTKEAQAAKVDQGKCTITLLTTRRSEGGMGEVSAVTLDEPAEA